MIEVLVNVVFMRTLQICKHVVYGVYYVQEQLSGLISVMKINAIIAVNCVQGLSVNISQQSWYWLLMNAAWVQFHWWVWPYYSSTFNCSSLTVQLRDFHKKKIIRWCKIERNWINLNNVLIYKHIILNLIICQKKTPRNIKIWHSDCQVTEHS